MAHLEGNGMACLEGKGMAHLKGKGMVRLEGNGMACLKGKVMPRLEGKGVSRLKGKVIALFNSMSLKVPQKLTHDFTQVTILEACWKNVQNSHWKADRIKQEKDRDSD